MRGGAPWSRVLSKFGMDGCADTRWAQPTSNCGFVRRQLPKSHRGAYGPRLGLARCLHRRSRIFDEDGSFAPSLPFPPFFPFPVLPGQLRGRQRRGERRESERGGEEGSNFVACSKSAPAARAACAARRHAVSVSRCHSGHCLRSLLPPSPFLPPFPFPSASAAHYCMYIFSEAERRVTYQFLVVEAGPRHGARQSGGVALRRHRLKGKR